MARISELPATSFAKEKCEKKKKILYKNYNVKESFRTSFIDEFVSVEAAIQIEAL